MSSCIASLDFFQRAQDLRGGIVSFRRRIHANPELSFEESETAKLVADAMRNYGYMVQEGIGGTGVVADLASPGYRGAPIGIRADMDALPIPEGNSCEYRSKRKGVMHACGHDAHVACALGAAKLLADAIHAGDIELSVRFLFQPAEETVNAEKKSGATLMMEAGAIEGLRNLIALHVFPSVPCGAIAVRSDYLLAACDSFTIRVKGKGCHGAFPELGIDSVVIATQLVQVLQTIISRRKPANDAGVLTIGGIRSNSFAPNVVADYVELTGTVRYFQPHLHQLFREEIERACSMVTSMGGSFELQYAHETPALRNDPAVTEVVRSVGQAMLGSSQVIECGQQLGADDFAYYTARIPSCYFVLGVKADRDTELHSPTFDLNEDALPIGAAMLAAAAVELSKS